MRRSIFQIAIIVSFLVVKDGLGAQLRLDFSQDNRTYIWNTSVDCAGEINGGLSWRFASGINSMLIKKSVFANKQDRWQEDGKVKLNLSYALTSRLKVGALFSQDINSLEKRRVTSSEYGLTSEYEISGVRLVQIVGGKDIDRRLEEGRRKDAGFNHRLTLSHSPQIISGSVTDISFTQTTSGLSNIPFSERDFVVFFSKGFSAEDSLEFTYQEGWARRKFYQGGLTNYQINTQSMNRRSINLRSSASVLLGIKLNFDFDLLLSGYRYWDGQTPGLPALTDNSSSARDLRLEARRGFFKMLSLGGFYKYGERDEDYADDQKDQKMKSGDLGGNLQFEISRTDSLSLTASIGVTSFFAPEVSARFNDRDILTLFAWGEYLHVFSPVFNLRLEGGFRNFHQVYISERLSANNNHNQTYVISPALLWRPHPKLDVRQRYNIQANYIYYDYEKSVESTRNRLFRRGSSSTSLTYRVFPRASLAFGYVYRYEDYGQLIWKDQWAQKPSWEQRTHTFSVKVNYSFSKTLSFSPEYTYERRKSWDHSIDLVTEKRIRSLSSEFCRNLLSVACKYFVSDGNYINLSAARRVQKRVPGLRETSDYATASVAWIF